VIADYIRFIISVCEVGSHCDVFVEILPSGEPRQEKVQQLENNVIKWKIRVKNGIQKLEFIKQYQIRKCVKMSPVVSERYDHCSTVRCQIRECLKSQKIKVSIFQ
jgi:hypothetical protein